MQYSNELERDDEIGAAFREGYEEGLRNRGGDGPLPLITFFMGIALTILFDTLR